METNFSLKGKVIVVTGGTGIIGNSFIKSIVGAGGIVGILGRNEKIAHQRVKEIHDKGGRAIALLADVTNEAQLLLARDKMLDAFGRIDGLVNAAGGNIQDAVVQPDQDIFSLNINALEQVMQLNLLGTILPTQVFGASIQQAGSGSIVNISSVVSQLAVTKVLGYSLAKSSIDSYTKWFATELAIRYGDAIRMNSIAPGFFLTEQNKTLLTNQDGTLTDRGNQVLQSTPFRRFGHPDELAGALIWLLSDASKFVTGSKITVDGGFTIFSGV
ncbi:putative oxidoreductase UxuB [Flavobacterium sp. CECT 9288]|uniref:SDR family oxidoreductase n=1 Tax=Flavobacterium sp. CECT 9288 TaxID=2845819 RepID=UPI001E291864|nr:SDR family oxidoreductase [Flavobacterium sp. CECT 9288]CAH0335531.1 putative oxidoreductase UxuB [Flavobacterium sp. CECT 9288]